MSVKLALKNLDKVYKFLEQAKKHLSKDLMKPIAKKKYKKKKN